MNRGCASGLYPSSPNWSFARSAQSCGAAGEGTALAGGAAGAVGAGAGARRGRRGRTARSERSHASLPGFQEPLLQNFSKTAVDLSRLARQKWTLEKSENASKRGGLGRSAKEVARFCFRPWVSRRFTSRLQVSPFGRGSYPSFGELWRGCALPRQRTSPVFLRTQPRRGRNEVGQPRAVQRGLGRGGGPARNCGGAQSFVSSSRSFSRFVSMGVAIWSVARERTLPRRSRMC